MLREVWGVASLLVILSVVALLSWHGRFDNRPLLRRLQTSPTDPLSCFQGCSQHCINHGEHGFEDIQAQDKCLGQCQELIGRHFGPGECPYDAAGHVLFPLTTAPPKPGVPPAHGPGSVQPPAGGEGEKGGEKKKKGPVWGEQEIKKGLKRAGRFLAIAWHSIVRFMTTWHGKPLWIKVGILVGLLVLLLACLTYILVKRCIRDRPQETGELQERPPAGKYAQLQETPAPHELERTTPREEAPPAAKGSDFEDCVMAYYRCDCLPAWCVYICPCFVRRRSGRSFNRPPAEGMIYASSSP
ncbi:unnamed protein product [Vitrella brassicaformis CCMP3155]|uniref:Uncharacterized protein n=1 Tax=Vitrella brassicaformis (strain CCMP3155) TaxID=1169540 RepID=A0A0G4EJT2_VITBC|nr:unnamed protein product [Vitrella brassicaformis CCMP3155]|eukprot:CEL97690.1 unnamed protein product [Vitrella brassicaformis CCMP3155]